MTEPGAAPRYGSHQAFRRALSSHYRNVAAASVFNAEQIKRQFLMHRFLARVFHNNQHQWILKGGIGLLIRFPESRHSRDIDLYNSDVDIAGAVAQLRDCARIDLDPFTFEVGQPTALIGASAAVKVPIQVYLGAQNYDGFGVDLAKHMDLVGSVEIVTPRPIIDIADVSPLPAIQLYPLASQIADKVCAMYELHKDGTPSSRYRDLADLVSIAQRCNIDSSETVAALAFQVNRRKMQMPPRIRVPADSWLSAYPAQARKSGLDTSVHSLEASLRVVSACIDPLLSETPPTGAWNPLQQRWDS